MTHEPKERPLLKLETKHKIHTGRLINVSISKMKLYILKKKPSPKVKRHTDRKGLQHMFRKWIIITNILFSTFIQNIIIDMIFIHNYDILFIQDTYYILNKNRK